jgi:hypothetical protein
MKYVLLAITLAVLLIPTLGCCCGTGGSCSGGGLFAGGICKPGYGVAYSPQERKARHRAIIDNDCRQFVDDCDYFWLMEEKSHLSKWHVK